MNIFEFAARQLTYFEIDESEKKKEQIEIDLQLSR